ncbi:MAG: chromate transporter [Alistipes sp.]|jgi:chromate transporter|nr:chromate transporter [Alistipes sp.]
MNRYFELFCSFLKIGVFTFGGGYAMIPIIQAEVITRKGWIKEQEFLDLLTLAQSAPGPISLNTAVFVGYKMYGYRGALSSLLGVVLPSFTILLMVAIFFSQIRENPIVDAAFRGMQPIVVAIMLAPILGFTKGMHWSMIAVAAAITLAIWHFGFSPIYLLIAGAAVGLLWAAARGEEVQR